MLVYCFFCLCLLVYSQLSPPIITRYFLFMVVLTEEFADDDFEEGVGGHGENHAEDAAHFPGD